MTATLQTPLAEVPAGLRQPGGRKLGYARVSTNDQEPEAQELRLIADGCERVWTDKGASGAKASRPEWDKLRAELRPGDTLVAIRLDRIGRSVGNLVEVAESLDANGVALRVLDQSIDTSTPTGRLLFHMLAAIAEFERDLIIERTKDGQAVVRANGNLRRSFGGPAPLGLRDPGPADDDSRDWITDERAAAMLTRIADAILPGPNGSESLASAFATERATWDEPMTDDSGREVNEKMVRAALRRPATAGLLSADDEFPVIADPPMDLALWRKVRALFDSRRAPGRPVSDGETYWAGPLLRCDQCGNQLSGSLHRPRDSRGKVIDGATPVPYYRCGNAHKALGVTRPCKSVSIQAEPVNEAIMTAVLAWAGSSRHLRAAARRGEGVASERQRIENELAGWLAQMEALLPTQRYVPPSSFAEARDAIAREIDRLEAERDALDTEAGASVVVLRDLDWPNMSGAERRQYAREVMVTPVVVRKGRGGGRPLPASERFDLVPYTESEAA
jgi:DNA invertase Pin-like site-specific DNA recombinase